MMPSSLKPLRQHRGWYSFFVSTAAGGVYTFGFVMMTPQLYINYKLQSVEHMPWRALTYKAMSTFVDDVAAFLIDMPWMHRNMARSTSCCEGVWGSADAAVEIIRPTGGDPSRSTDFDPAMHCKAIALILPTVDEPRLKSSLARALEAVPTAAGRFCNNGPKLSIEHSV
eukprot:g23111.t1